MLFARKGNAKVLWGIAEHLWEITQKHWNIYIYIFIPISYFFPSPWPFRGSVVNKLFKFTVNIFVVTFTDFVVRHNNNNHCIKNKHKLPFRLKMQLSLLGYKKIGKLVSNLYEFLFFKLQIIGYGFLRMYD